MSRNCSIVLNAHIPWVRHPEVPQCLEEDWLHSTILETHLPLLEMLLRLRSEKVPFHLTINLSPTLLAMFQDPVLRRRTIAYLDRTIQLCRDEVERSDVTGLGDLARQYEDRFYRLRSFYVDEWKGDLIKAYTSLRDSGHLEITACAATHGVLPLMMRTPEAVQSQIRVGIRQYVQAFGRLPKGFWMPECAYAPALGKMLKREGIEWIVVEEHGLTESPMPHDHFPFIPGSATDGLSVFGRNQESCGEVWSADEGFPGDRRYRDFMRDLGLEAPIEYLKDFLGESEQRQLTGIKYYRSEQSEDGNSETYDPALASKALEEHSLRFVSSRGAQLAALEASGVEDPIVVCAFDADLFGHWWYEGTEFLERVFRKTADRGDFSFVNPASYLAEHKDTEWPEAAPVSSSWGEGGYFEIWTTQENNWVQEEIQKRSEKLAHFVRMFEINRRDYAEDVMVHQSRCIQIMTKELMLAQSSDWSFLMRNEPSREYAESRTRQHLAHFDEAWEFTTQPHIGEEKLEELEGLNPIFTELPWNLFEPIS